MKHLYFFLAGSAVVAISLAGVALLATFPITTMIIGLLCFIYGLGRIILE